MILTTKIYAIAMILISMIVAIAIYYIMTNASKEEKRKQLNELTSQLVNFVLYIWLAKILLNLSLFLEDPLAVLAYPSNGEAFYLATLFTVITIAIQSYRGKLQVIPLVLTFIPVFLISVFFFEFLQLTIMDDLFVIGNIIVSGLLIVCYYWVHEKVSVDVLLMVMLAGWSAGMLALTLIQPFVTLFDYLMKPWFIGLFFVVMFSLILLKRKRWEN
ncbi:MULTISPECIES: hypothetical protein [Allobacillus]|uniref:Uncharacterized protein n=1 Tax=Allobacillus salarius TaxID=1955272 RepID=A0A556PBH6_9BACI|nr:hypothetical protein [Allobacillus salarius]TSJ61747.1 hypothetical protein FPQ13_11030 [Allobacillus salarius]